MAGQDIKRGYDIRRLFEEQLAKVDHKLDHPQRMQEAAKLMDKIVGKEWRGEAELPGIEIIEVGFTKGEPKASDPQGFYSQVHDRMKDEGLDFNHDEPENTHEEMEKREGSLKDQIMCAIGSLLDRVLGGR